MRYGRLGRRCSALLALTILALSAAAAPAPAAAAERLAVVANTDGEGLNLRDAPSLDGAILLGMPEGATVTVLEDGVSDDAGTAWARLDYAGVEGYGAAAYLDAAPQEGAAAPDIIPVDDTGSDPSALRGQASVGGTGGDGLNLRAGPGVDAAVVTGLTEGSVVTVVGDPAADASGDPWYPIAAAGVLGWAYGAYLVAADPTPAGADAIGDALVAEALSFVGTPYVWGGVTPDGFDCSGFAYFVVNDVLGNDFPRAMTEQLLTGEYVSRDDLQPGDLIFLENTYQPGLSHIGFYIGDGQFVSAVNEEDGIAIRDLTDDYWSARYLTARRVR